MASRQVELFTATPAMTRAALIDVLNADMSRPVAVTLTRNRVTMASVAFPAPRDQPVKLRLHQEFLNAPTPVIQALRLYIRTRLRAAWREVATFAKAIDPGSHASAAARPALTARGRIHDLEAIGREINLRYFNGCIGYRIGWGRGRPAGRRRRRRAGKSIRYGSWNAATRTIRIHPLLDDARVPARFVAYIVFHEMLHAVVPDEHRNGRRYPHALTFRRLERQFEGIETMHRLSRELLERLV